MKKIIITTGVIAVAGGLATALLTPSCNVDCDVPDKPSVIVQFIDESSHPAGQKFVAADEVRYEWTDPDSGAKLDKAAECMDDECTEWMIGNGQPGTYTFHAKVCGDSYESSVTLDYNEDGCQVDTQIVQMPVNTAACTDIQPGAASPAAEGEPPTPTGDVSAGGTCTLEVRPSVIATVAVDKGTVLVPIAADRVFYQWSNEPNSRELPGKCINDDCSQFMAGAEEVGDFVLGAEVCGQSIRASATVGKTPDGCHVLTQHTLLVVDGKHCATRPDDTIDDVAPPVEGGGENPNKLCNPTLWPSAIVTPVEPAGDMWMPHPTESLYYVHDDQRHKGSCVEEADNGKCLMWVTGWGETGRFKAFTEACGEEQSVGYAVELSADGCLPKTAYVPVFVDTRGCITPPVPSPSTPDDIR